MNDDQLLEAAMRLAAKFHDGQFRKGTRIPYITHPASVALILTRHGISDAPILATAWLHDLLEDTDCSEVVLRNAMPTDVVECVIALSETKLDSAGNKRPWIDRKREHLEVVRASPWPVKAVALADKLHNGHSILFDIQVGRDPWAEFNADADRVMWYYREMLAASSSGEPQLTLLSAALKECIEALEQSR